MTSGGVHCFIFKKHRLFTVFLWNRLKSITFFSLSAYDVYMDVCAEGQTVIISVAMVKLDLCSFDIGPRYLRIIDERKKRMKILLASFFQPSTGGYWTYIHQLQRGLQLKNYEVNLLYVDFATQNYCLTNAMHSFVKSTVHPAFLEKKYPPFSKMTMPESIAKLEMSVYNYGNAAKYFDLSQYDLIHAQDVMSARALARVKPKHVPLITTIHGVFSDELIRLSSDYESSYVNYCCSLEPWGVQHSTLVIVPSKAMMDFLHDRFELPADKFRVVRHGLDIANFLKEMNEGCIIEKPPHKKVIACVARLSEEKGLDVLMRSLLKLKQLNKNWICWIIGNGPLMPDLKQMRTKWRLNDHVLFLGDRSDVPALLKKADLFVLASRQESLGYAILEAQLAGKPIVATQTGGIPEIVEHGETGLLSKPEDSETMCAYLLKLLENDSFSAALGARARKKAVQGYTLENMVNNTLSIYEEAYRIVRDTGSKGGKTL